jgi:hypothetical protein
VHDAVVIMQSRGYSRELGTRIEGRMRRLATHDDKDGEAEHQLRFLGKACTRDFVAFAEVRAEMLPLSVHGHCLL